MCGIAGLWNVTAPHPLDNVRSMLDAMRHRGPDGSGTLEFAGGAGGMVRLALVDLSSRGQQPLWSEDRRVAIIYNGEIYNFRSERKRLESAGHRFHTGTDTEVALGLYLEHGLDFHRYMRGMYALAIFDWRRAASGGLPELLLARGPLGIKHLYIAHPGGDRRRVIFSSEIRSLLASGLMPRRIDNEAVADFLALGFVPQPQTMISGVRMLEPGSFEHYIPGQDTVHGQYWHMPAYEPRQETFSESAARLRALLEESVELHSMADAPVGAFLSGGIDSTGIVGLMRKHVPNLHTYTLKFPDVAGTDEATEAEEAARQFDCRHTTVEVTGREVADVLPRFAGDMDQPSKDGLNTWLVSRAAARDVKAVLSGVGGDEWFAGYPVTRRMARYATTPSGRALAMAGSVANLVYPWLPRSRFRHRMESLASRRNSLSTWLQPHAVFRPRTARRMAGLHSPGISYEQRLADLLKVDCGDWTRETPVGVSCLLDTRIFMIHQLLRDSDAASMAHSLELRVPLVDLELVSFARTCPDDYRLLPDGGDSSRYLGSGSKRVLIEALRDILPPSISHREKKGFVLPFSAWMEREVAPLIQDTCGESSVRRRGLLDPDLVAHVRGATGSYNPRYPRLWTLMILELWCRSVLDVQHDEATPRPTMSV
jgi:asparagine synthase (glutamine-hydrolysing)